MNPADQTRSWRGYENLEYLFIFGASTSDVGYRHGSSPQPTKEHPLGMEYPGTTWTERDEANWVGHLVNQYTHSHPLVYNFAVGGHTLEGYREQIIDSFIDGVGREDSGVAWTAENSLFVSAIGGNDLANEELDIISSMTEIFELQYKLYEAGARNFVIFNVAPLPPPADNASGERTLGEQDRLSGSKSKIRTFVYEDFTRYMLSKREERCGEWNVMLPPFIDDFMAAYPDSTMFLFDLYSHYKKMQEDPTSYGFSEKAGRMYDGEMYVDNIHPSSKAHKHVAWHFGSFLSGKEMDKEREERLEK
ncbi:hypothetical protein FRB90_009251 [Tulasnella sp. 427]|nr:hypothetical protein FRB90_009251 [Tulasnella sp. 427]